MSAKFVTLWRGLSTAHNANECSIAMENLIKIDMQSYGEEWTINEQRRTYVFITCLFLFWIFLVFLSEVVFIRLDFFFWAKLVLQNILLILVFCFCGYCVLFYALNESYSRKICHVCAYVLPISLHFLWRQQKANLINSLELTWACWFQFFPFMALIKPVRRRRSALMIAFRAIDRVQDRPYTLTWMLSQLVGNYVAILLMHVYLASKRDEYGRLAILPMLINVLGDGLAEPVGVRWGKNKYVTSALWYNGSFCSGTFERSYEGSACVFFVTLIGLVPFRELFTATQFVVSMVFLPVTMTLCEAWAPHTWDNPFLTGICTLFIIFIFEFVP